jgi:hypothetical protein
MWGGSNSSSCLMGAFQVAIARHAKCPLVYLNDGVRVGARPTRVPIPGELSKWPSQVDRWGRQWPSATCFSRSSTAGKSSLVVGEVTRSWVCAHVETSKLGALPITAAWVQER